MEEIFITLQRCSIPLIVYFITFLIYFNNGEKLVLFFPAILGAGPVLFMARLYQDVYSLMLWALMLLLVIAVGIHHTPNRTSS